MSPTLIVDQDMAVPELIEVAGGVAAIFSRKSPLDSTCNEDAAAILPAGPDAAILIVADGMGGAPGGEHAARLVVEAVARSLGAATDGSSSFRGAILDGIEAANRDILALSIGAGATIALVEIRRDVARPFHVGDSIVLHFGGRGKTKYRTTDHSPTGYGIEAGLLNESEAVDHEHRHILANAVGMPEMFIELGPEVVLAAQDTIVIASDGLTDNLYVDEIRDIVRKGPLKKAARRLAEQARLRMQGDDAGQPSKPDDLTFILFRPGSLRKRKKPSATAAGGPAQ